MKGTALLALFHFMTILSVSDTGKAEVLSCTREQFVNENEKGNILCKITARFYGVYWYAGRSSKDSIIRLIDGKKAGPDFVSGKLDIAENGSLIINNASLSDEMYYRVMVVLSAGGDVSKTVYVTVVVRTTFPTPRVDGCDTSDLPCVLCVDKVVTLGCHMDGKPFVMLTWFDVISGAILDHQNYSSISDVSTRIFSSTARVTIPLTTPGQEILLVCGASGKAVSSSAKNISVLVASPSATEDVGKTVYFLPNNSLILNTDVNLVGNELIAWIRQTKDLGRSYNQYHCEYIAGSLGKTNITVFNPLKQDEGTYTSISWTNGAYKRYPLLLLEGEPPTITNFSYSNSSGQATLDVVVKSVPLAEINWEKNQTNQTKVSSVSSSCSYQEHSCNVSVTVNFETSERSCTCIIFNLDGPWPKDSYVRTEEFALCGKGVNNATATTIQMETVKCVDCIHGVNNATATTIQMETVKCVDCIHDTPNVTTFERVDSTPKKDSVSFVCIAAIALTTLTALTTTSIAGGCGYRIYVKKKSGYHIPGKGSEVNTGGIERETSTV